MIVKEILEKIIQKNSLTQDEASALMEEIMDGNLTPAQVSAILVALRIKGETVDEVTGFAKIMRKKVQPFSSKHPFVLDTCGTGGDGSKTFNISTTAAFVISAAGVPVAKHGNSAVSSQCGSADILKGLGVKIDADKTVMEKALNEIGICFLFAPFFHPAMKHASVPRKEIGIRTVFNILGPLTNPAGAQSQIMGVYKKELTDLLAHVLSNLGTQHAFVVHGEDGLDEITITGKTYISEVKNGKVTNFEFAPQTLDISLSKIQDIQGGDLTFNIDLTRSILFGKKGPQRDIVLVNAAFGLLAANAAKDIKEAFQKAAEAVDSGRALKKLHQLVELTQTGPV
jgi:anthranilate phosphoribosyltransferase